MYLWEINVFTLDCVRWELLFCNGTEMFVNMMKFLLPLVFICISQWKETSHVKFSGRQWLFIVNYSSWFIQMNSCWQHCNTYLHLARKESKFQNAFVTLLAWCGNLKAVFFCDVEVLVLICWIIVLWGICFTGIYALLNFDRFSYIFPVR